MNYRIAKLFIEKNSRKIVGELQQIFMQTVEPIGPRQSARRDFRIKRKGKHKTLNNYKRVVWALTLWRWRSTVPNWLRWVAVFWLLPRYHSGGPRLSKIRMVCKFHSLQHWHFLIASALVSLAIGIKFISLCDNDWFNTSNFCESECYIRFEITFFFDLNKLQTSLWIL